MKAITNACAHRWPLRAAQNSRPRKFPTLLLSACLVFVIPLQVLTAQNLPSMGEPADASLSPAAERELGEQFMRQVRASVPVIRDSLLVEYMQALGNRLAANVVGSGYHQYEFFVIDNANINAFAIPGGFIGMNSGLIEAMDSEDQLAAVVGHEIAHITQRHHARSVASSSRTRMTTAFAVLAALIIGQSNPQAGQAALAAGLAATQQTMINFTRSNEHEADRIGIKVLSDAGYRPAAMAEAFEILRRKNSINTSSNQLEYLRTHPLDNTRIAEAKNRAANLRQGRSEYSRSEFAMFKARLAVLTTQDRARIERDYRSKLSANSEVTRKGAQYAMALLAMDKHQYDNAKSYLDTLLSKERDNLFVQLLKAEVQYARGATKESLSTLALLQSTYPENFAIVELEVSKLLESRRTADAQRSMLGYIRSADRPNNAAWLNLANIEQKLGNESASHEALANYFIGLNIPERASQQLRLAIRSIQGAGTGKNSNDELRLRAKLRELVPEE